MAVDLSRAMLSFPNADSTRVLRLLGMALVGLEEEGVWQVAGGEVEVAYSSNVSMVGRLATFGERIMRAKVNKVANTTPDIQDRVEPDCLTRLEIDLTGEISLAPTLSARNRTR